MEKIQRFLYNTLPGRVLLKLLIQPPVSKIGGFLLNSRPSSILIRPFIKHNKIAISEYENRPFISFNDFFTRKIIPEKRPFSKNRHDFISPCDAALTVYEINSNSVFKIKNSVYTLSELTGTDCNEFSGGKCLVFRLAVNNYHRYIFIDDGTLVKSQKFKGVLHTVMPISSDYNVFSRNSREVTALNTDNFGKIIQIEVGALMVGKISNKPVTAFSKGDEKGMFEFGGSTIVLLIKKDSVVIRDDIIKNSANGIETPVKCGETIGTSM